MNHYPHHIGDFNSATRHLTRVERSLYRDMIDMYYDTEQPLNSDVQKLARRLIATSEEELAALHIVLEEFFILSEDGWRNHRCDTEIAKYQGQIEQASRAGKASAAKRNGKNSTHVERPLNQPEPEPEPIKEAKASSSTAALPDCPHNELIDLFAAKLPMLPQPNPELWSGARAKALKARWVWVLTAQKRNGERYATDKQSAMAFFARFFDYVSSSDFLSGRNGQWTGCDLAWLANEANFAKVTQGNYDNKEAA